MKNFHKNVTNRFAVICLAAVLGIAATAWLPVVTEIVDAPLYETAFAGSSGHQNGLGH